MSSTSTSCSFRITRTAEDLAHTINALSQRLVKLEQRQEALEIELHSQDSREEEIERLNAVDELIRECKELLDASDQVDNDVSDDAWNDDASETLAA